MPGPILKLGGGRLGLKPALANLRNLQSQPPRRKDGSRRGDTPCSVSAACTFGAESTRGLRHLGVKNWVGLWHSYDCRSLPPVGGLIVALDRVRWAYASLANLRRCAPPTRAKSRFVAEMSCPAVGGKACLRVCPIRAPFSRVLGTLILRRQFGTRWPEVTVRNGWGTFCTGKGTFSDSCS